jgi:hypothetical protein
LKLKLGMAISYLESGTWRRIAVNVSTALSQLNAMFQRRFENE